MEKKKN